VPPGSPFFFKLKRQHNAIGGFGVFARFARLPVWRAWDIFGTANGTRDEHDLLARLDRLSAPVRRQEGRNRVIGCIAVIEPVFFAPDEWVAIPSDWSPNIVRGRVEDLASGEAFGYGTNVLTEPLRSLVRARGLATPLTRVASASPRW